MRFLALLLRHKFNIVLPSVIIGAVLKFILDRLSASPAKALPPPVPPTPRASPPARPGRSQPIECPGDLSEPPPAPVDGYKPQGTMETIKVS